MDTQSVTKPRLPFVAKLVYGMGTVAFGIKDQGFGVLLMLFYNQVMGMSAAWVGGAIMIAMVADALIDPILGHISDNTRSRWGRRHPYMYAAAIPAAVSYFWLWNPPQASTGVLFAYLIFVAIAVRVSISLYEIPSTALLAEFTTDYNERTRLVGYRFFFGVVAGILMNIVAFKYFLLPTVNQPIGQLNAAGYRTYAFVSAAIMLVFLFVSSLGTHRRTAAISPPLAHGPSKPSEIFRTMRQILFHRTYVSILFASLFFAITSGLVSSLGIYFSTYLWRLTASQIATISVGAFLGIGLAFVFALPLSTRFGKKFTAMGLFALALISGTAPLVLRLLGSFPASTSPLFIPVLSSQTVFTTMCSIAGAVLAVSMVADVTEQVQLSTGTRAEGLLFAAATFVNKAVSGMGVLISGILLSVVHFSGNAAPSAVASESILRLAVIFIGATSLFSGLAIFSLAFYPISRSSHSDAVNRLREKDSEQSPFLNGRGVTTEAVLLQEGLQTGPQKELRYEQKRIWF